LRNTRVGQQVEVKLLRAGNPATAHISLGSRPARS
jgi:hypothetical protein